MSKSIPKEEFINELLGFKKNANISEVKVIINDNHTYFNYNTLSFGLFITFMTLALKDILEYRTFSVSKLENSPTYIKIATLSFPENIFKEEVLVLCKLYNYNLIEIINALKSK